VKPNRSVSRSKATSYSRIKHCNLTTTESEPCSYQQQQHIGTISKCYEFGSRLIWAYRDRFVGEKGAAAGLLVVDPRSRRTEVDPCLFFLFWFRVYNLRSSLFCCFFVIYELRFEQRRERGVGIYKFFSKKSKKNSDAAALRPTTASEWLRPPLSSRRRRAPLGERRELLSLLLLCLNFRERFFVRLCCFFGKVSFYTTIFLFVLVHACILQFSTPSRCEPSDLDSSKIWWWMCVLPFNTVCFLPMLSCVFDV